MATDTENTGKVTTYLYDDLGRLTSEAITGTNNNSTLTYTYDDRGNRLTQSRGNATVTYTYDLNNRLTSHTASGVVTIYSYDNNGNTISTYVGGNFAGGYTYDLFNRQKTYTPDGTVFTTTTYRPDGMRHSIGNTKHICDNGNIVGDITGSTYKQYFRALNLIYNLVGTTKQYYRYNGHGDVVALTNATGTVTKTYTYNAFGEEQNINATDANPFRYCGEYYDKVSGTLYLRARNYNASIGRFTQEDPIERISNSSVNDIELLCPEQKNSYSFENSNAISKQLIKYIDQSNYIELQYLYYIFLGLPADSVGSSIPQLTVPMVMQKLIPLPPLAEQKRIVEKIEQAFSALDTIDALQAKYADNLTVLKSKLIDFAIRGKLTEQLPEDGTAEDLYQQIQEEKQALIKSGKIKKEKPLPEITEDEIPFEIPGSWKWVRAETIGVTVTGGTPAKAHPEYYGGDYPFFKPSDLDAGRHITIASEYLSESGKAVARQLQKGTILVCCIGSIGKCAIIDNDGTANQQINALTPILCDSDYLLYAISSSSFNCQLNQGSRATTVSIISKSKFDNCIIPLPPLAEHQRIVDRLNKLLAVCDEMR